MIGMPFYTGPLLSNLPEMIYCPPSSPFFNQPRKIPFDVLAELKVVGSVGYAPTPPGLKGKRSMVESKAMDPAGKSKGKEEGGGKNSKRLKWRLVSVMVDSL